MVQILTLSFFFLKVRGRIMVDRATFRRLNTNYQMPIPIPPKSEEIPGAQVDHRFGPQFDMYGNPVPPPVVAPFTQGLRRNMSMSTVNLTQIPIRPPDNLVQTQSGDATADVELTEEDLLLTPTVVFGFSLVDKVWCQFSRFFFCIFCEIYQLLL